MHVSEYYLTAGLLRILECIRRLLIGGRGPGRRNSTTITQMLIKKQCIRESVNNTSSDTGGVSREGEIFPKQSCDLEQQRSPVDTYACVNLLKMYTKTRDLAMGRQVHAHISQTKLHTNVFVMNNLMNMYLKCGALEDAREVFDKIVKKDVVSWTIMIGGYARYGGHDDDAWNLFCQMQQEEGVKANRITYLSILDACSSAKALEWGKEIHNHIKSAELGLEFDMRIGTALVTMYAKCGSIRDAQLVFDKMVKRDTISWTSLIEGYAQQGNVPDALDLFCQMQEAGVKPNQLTYMSLLNACSSPATLKQGREVHAHIIKAGISSNNVHLGNALINMYAKCGSITEAKFVFDGMRIRNVVSWNAMIGGFALHGCGQEAVQAFEQMRKEGFRPDSITFVVLLSACSHAGLVDEGRNCFASLSREYGLQPSIFHFTCMVDLLGRAGHLEEAEMLIKSMPLKANTAIWGALLSACRRHGNVALGEHAANSSLRLNPNDDGVYMLLSQVYGAAGMWEDVTKVRNLMKEKGIRKEPGRSWIEVESRVHSFLSEDRRHPEVEEIHSELRRLMKEIKRLGYVPDTRLVEHDVDEQQKEEALCHHSEKLAIAYGVLKTAPGTPIHISKNLRVCTDCHTATKFISKITGREIVARDANRFHHFKDGLCSCGDYW